MLSRVVEGGSAGKVKSTASGVFEVSSAVTGDEVKLTTRSGVLVSHEQATGSSIAVSPSVPYHLRRGLSVWRYGGRDIHRGGQQLTEGREASLTGREFGRHPLFMDMGA